MTRISFLLSGLSYDAPHALKYILSASPQLYHTSRQSHGWQRELGRAKRITISTRNKRGKRASHARAASREERERRAHLLDSRSSREEEAGRGWTDGRCEQQTRQKHKKRAGVVQRREGSRGSLARVHREPSPRPRPQRRGSRAWIDEPAMTIRVQC